MLSQKIVTIGGGTGTHTVLSGLKKFPLDLTAVVTVADSGGSTGRLRDEFGILPVGDFRMALTALASTEEDSDILRKLFLYRFEKGSDGLRGHNFGNLFLVAMSDVLGSYEKAIKHASRILNTKGRILPITSSPVDLYAEYADGSIVKGEANIDIPSSNCSSNNKITRLWIEPDATIDAETSQAILDADYIIFGPGDLYTSILPNIVIAGSSAAICKSRAKIIYVVNLVTKFGQTHQFTAKDHIDELSRYTGRIPDYIIVNSTPMPEQILEKYREEDAYPVLDDLRDSDGYTVIRADVLTSSEIQRAKGDAVRRSLLRHDPDKLAWEIVKVVMESCFRDQKSF